MSMIYQSPLFRLKAGRRTVLRACMWIHFVRRFHRAKKSPVLVPLIDRAEDWAMTV